MSAESIEEAKAALRLKARAARAAIGDADRVGAAAEAARHFLSGIALRADEIVAAYWPIREELDVKPLLGQLMDRGQPVCLPVVRGEEEPLDMRLWEQGMPLYPSGFGTLHSVRPSAALSKTPAFWARPSMPLGSHPPEWPSR